MKRCPNLSICSTKKKVSCQTDYWCTKNLHFKIVKFQKIGATQFNKHWLFECKKCIFVLSFFLKLSEFPNFIKCISSIFFYPFYRADYLVLYNLLSSFANWSYRCCVIFFNYFLFSNRFLLFFFKDKIGYPTFVHEIIYFGPYYEITKKLIASSFN